MEQELVFQRVQTMDDVLVCPHCGSKKLNYFSMKKQTVKCLTCDKSIEFWEFD